MTRHFNKIKNPIYQPNDISNFMLTAENISKLINDMVIEPKKVQSVQEKKSIHKKINHSDFITPKYNDKLFWAWMIFYYGMVEYEMTQNHNWQKESTEKIKMIENIRKHKHLLKEVKLKKNKLEAELTVESDISINVIIALCVIHNFNFIYIKNKTYYKFDSKSPTKTLIIQSINNDTQVYIGDDYDKYESKVLNLWRVYDLNKPLKSLTVYKLKELQKICNILNLPINDSSGKKKTKKLLYNSILNEI